MIRIIGIGMWQEADVHEHHSVMCHWCLLPSLLISLLNSTRASERWSIIYSIICITQYSVKYSEGTINNDYV